MIPSELSGLPSEQLRSGKHRDSYLFDLRSTFVRGRAGLLPISTPHRVLARSVAIGAASALVRLVSLGLSREILLAQLLDSGIDNLPKG